MAHTMDPKTEAAREASGARTPSTPASSREIDRFDHNERECLELAFDIAVTDPTEEDYLRHGQGSLSAAWQRLGGALGELLKASLAMIAALAGRLMLAGAARAVRRKQRRPLTSAQSSIYSLHELMKLMDLMGGRPSTTSRKVLGRQRRHSGQTRALILLILGARRQNVSKDSADSDSRSAVSMKLAGRKYRAGLTPSGLGYKSGPAEETYAADTPVVRALLGVSVRKDEDPVYRVRRFVKNVSGRYDEVGGYHSLDPEDAYRAFASGPTLNDLQKIADSQQTNDHRMTADPETPQVHSRSPCSLPRGRAGTCACIKIKGGRPRPIRG